MQGEAKDQAHSAPTPPETKQQPKRGKPAGAPKTWDDIADFDAEPDIDAVK